jgi:peptidoglycan/xylan/chitin deacetylase (PgdA/CDA1 family)
MRIVTPFLKQVVYPSLSQTRFFRSMAQSGLAVVTYHGVVPRGCDSIDASFNANLITAEIFRRQLRLVKSKYSVISPEDVREWLRGERELPKQAVLLTCDDGLLNNLTEMLPILREEQLSCLFFVTTPSSEEARSCLWYEELLWMFLQAPEGAFEISIEEVSLSGMLHTPPQRRTVWWSAVKRLSQLQEAKRKAFLRSTQEYFNLEPSQPCADENSGLCRRFGLMNAAELRTLAGAGMTIGAHTVSHPMLSQMPHELARAEILESAARLDAALGSRPWAFAYPFGDAQSVTPEVLKMPEDAGFEAAFMNYAGGLGSDLPAFAMPRIHVSAEMSLAEFEANVSGFYSWLQRRVGRTPP